MSLENVIIEKENKIATLTINRPQSLNALNKQTIQELSEAFESLKTDKEVRAIVLTGSGEKSFVAGADIKEFSDFNQEKAEELAKSGQDSLFNKIENMKCMYQGRTKNRFIFFAVAMFFFT